jgi:hypothetical protein
MNNQFKLLKILHVLLSILCGEYNNCYSFIKCLFGSRYYPEFLMKNIKQNGKIIRY